MLDTKYKVAIGLASLATAFACGRFLAPEKVRVETKTVEVEKKTEQLNTKTDVNKHKETTVVEVVKPDGTHTKTTKITEDTNTDKAVHSTETEQVAKKEDDTKEVTKSSKTLNVAILGGTSVRDLSGTVYGGAVSASLIGPVTVGVFGLSSGVIGTSVGLNF